MTTRCSHLNGTFTAQEAAEVKSKTTPSTNSPEACRWQGDRSGGGPCCPVISLPLCPERRGQCEGADASGRKAWHPSPELCCGESSCSPSPPPKGLAGRMRPQSKGNWRQGPPVIEASAVTKALALVQSGVAAEGHSSSKHPGVFTPADCRRGAASATTQKPHLGTWHQESQPHPTPQDMPGPVAETEGLVFP